jgi:hypothetical protein
MRRRGQGLQPVCFNAVSCRWIVQIGIMQKDAYPERMYRCFILNAPSFFTVPLLKPIGCSCPIDMQNRNFGSYLTTIHRILISVMRSSYSCPS